MKYRAVKGMNDILPDTIERWQVIENAFRDTLRLYRFSEVRTPLLESTDLFIRSIGEATDVVEKEMFTFLRSNESLSMRPEGTAGAARAYVEHKIANREPVSRWFYIGPMFRAEQPQRGRYRQFYQAGCEIYGDPGPLCDAELLAMLYRFLSGLGIADLELCINSIGGAETRERYRVALQNYLRPRAAELSEHAQQRIELNPLRILDSKDKEDRIVVSGAPNIIDFLDGDDLKHWNGLCTNLNNLGIPYRIDHGLVRGLDYYTRTLFEVKTNAGQLGSQNTICGGGRYNNMISDLGGSTVPAIGFAMGLERLLLASGFVASCPKPFIFIAPFGENAGRKALHLSETLRSAGWSVELDGREGSIKSMLRRANSLAAPIALVIGDSEVEQGVVQLKDLVGHTQESVPLTELVEHLNRLL